MRGLLWSVAFVGDVFATLCFPFVVPAYVCLFANFEHVVGRGLPETKAALIAALSPDVSFWIGFTSIAAGIAGHIGIALLCRHGIVYRPLWVRYIDEQARKAGRQAIPERGLV